MNKIDKAIQTLDGMASIARAEMLEAGEYIEEEVSNPKLAERGAICGGRKHCAIGSMLAGGGVRPKVETHTRPYGGSTYTIVSLPGADQFERDDFLRHRPGLRLAYGCLNEAAQQFAARRGMELYGSYEAAIEDLFEGHYGDDLTKGDMLRIIASAKRKVLNHA